MGWFQGACLLTLKYYLTFENQKEGALCQKIKVYNSVVGVNKKLKNHDDTYIIGQWIFDNAAVGILATNKHW